ncbi:MAG: ABC transporter ATP-binding protein [Candidatus Hydrogenedentes bacterium]|nr:ABC transporter ATP-binding protein [Candidatus Hydrogenedentota bacterium]
MLEARNVKKHYLKHGVQVPAIDGVTLDFSRGEFAIVHGVSGSGKTTLLLLLGGMLRPSSGSVHYEGADIYAWSGVRRNRFRNAAVGFIFQKFYLMPYLTVYDNIRLPLALRGDRRDVAGRVQAVAERLQIAHRLTHTSGELSVGEQQRVAMARTLVAEPDFILADEPTGNLDKINCDILADCLIEENKKGRLIVLATHEASLMSIGTRRIRLESGRVVEEEAGSAPSQ